MKLFKAKEGELDSFKCQVLTFFLTTITMLSLRLILHWLFFIVDFNHLIVNVWSTGNPEQIFALQVANSIIMLAELVFNAIVVYNLVD